MKVIIRILTLLLLATLVFNFVGCAKCINTEYKDVEVIIVNKYYKGSWLQPIMINGKTRLIPHSATYRIIVEYDGALHIVSGINTYNKYKDKIGQTAIGKLKIETYNNGTIKYHLVSLE